MMALSRYFNCDSLQIPIETNTFHQVTPEEEAAVTNLQHLFSYSDESFLLSNALFENYIDPTSGFFHPYDPFTPLTHHHDDNIYPTHEEDYNNLILPCPKRQKCCYEEQQQLQQEQEQQVYSSMQEITATPPTIQSNFLEGFVVPDDNYCSLQVEELYPYPQLFSEVPQYGSTTTCVDVHECEKKGNNNERRTISPQSVAARERRRKITEKTQELGKLVPGGPKMNTAEMLHAAAKYVMFLQAQVGMLQLINTLEEDKATPYPSDENLHSLVVSPFVQEKLYTEEMCFVPKESVTTLTNNEDVQSKPIIIEDLKQLIGTDNIEKKPKQE